MLAAILSVGLPGAGHIYLGRRVLGALEMSGGLVLLGLALLRLGAVFMEALEGRTPPVAILRACVPWGLAIGAYSIASGLFTWLMSRRLVVPARSGRSSG